ncbi:AAA family ATPase [Shewanella sp. PP-He15 brown]
MTIQSIKITNLLSFDELEVKDLKDMNCIVGRNNVGKSNLLKALKFFYNKLDGKEEISLNYIQTIPTKVLYH